MSKNSNNYRLASAAIDDISQIKKLRLLRFIANYEFPEKLIPYLKGENYSLFHKSLINGKKCHAIKTNLFDVLIKDRVDYWYEAEEFKTVYINPIEFSSIIEINELFQSDNVPKHSLIPDEVYNCPFVILFKVKKRGVCTYNEWQESRIDEGTFYLLIK